MHWMCCFSFTSIRATMRTSLRLLQIMWLLLVYWNMSLMPGLRVIIRCVQSLSCRFYHRACLADNSVAKNGRCQDGRRRRFTFSIHNDNACNISDTRIPYWFTILCEKQTINFCPDGDIDGWWLLLNDLWLVHVIRKSWQLAGPRPTPSYRRRFLIMLISMQKSARKAAR